MEPQQGKKRQKKRNATFGKRGEIMGEFTIIFHIEAEEDIIKQREFNLLSVLSSYIYIYDMGI